jgi:drug/metabolite transporter (DMT)-like permease
VSARHATLLAALAVIWGGSYLLIKYGLEDLQPAVIVWVRCVLAAIVLFAVLRLRAGGSEARAALAELRARPGRALLMGFLAIGLPFTLITFGELEVPSGLTAVLIAPASLFVAAFAPFIDRSEQVKRSGVLGMVMGLVGVALLVGVESVQSLGEFLGAMAMLGAAACYALSSFVVKGYRGLSSTAVSFLSIMVGAVMTLPAAVATAPAELPGMRAVAAVTALGVVGTAVAFVILYKLIAETGAARASLVSYLAPGMALAYGALLLDEAITPASVAGLVLILGGVALASRRPRPGPVAASEQAPRRGAEPGARDLRQKSLRSRSHGPDPLAPGDGVPRRGAELAGREPSRADARR